MSNAMPRGAFFVALLVLLGAAEWRWPRHEGPPRRFRRWPANLGFGIAGVLCLRVLTPWLAVDAALWAKQENFVLLHLLGAPTWLHRIHHSIKRSEQDSNFGFNLSCWDRLFGSYRDRSEQPQATLTLGLAQFREAPAQRFDKLLLQPFRGK